MSVPNRISMLVLSIVTLCLGVMTSSCGSGGSGPKLANVTAGDMPSGASWTGVYYSPNYGELHLVQDGNLVKGRWERPVKGRWGEMQGNVQGNLLKFDWSEYVNGLVGPGAKKNGKGYFLYTRPEGENMDDVIKGEIGRGDDEVGEPEWSAVKQRNVKSNPDSIGGVGSSEIKGGDWDTENTEKGAPEPPAEPDEGKEPPKEDDL